MHFTKHTLKNGFRVLSIPMRDTQTITALILVEAGSKYENKGNNGISHFLEHMMFKGTKKRPKTKIITEELDSIGGEYNAFTSKEQTGYWVKVASKYADTALDVVSDLYLNPLLEEKEIEKEKGVILQEAAMYRDTPMRYIWDVFEDLLYGDQPAGWDIIGTEPNIIKFGRKDFVDYLQNHYLPESTLIVVAGNFDEEKVLAQIEKQFGHIKVSAKKKGKLATIQKQTKPAVKIFYKETDQTHLLCGVRASSMFDADRHVAVVMGTVLGGGMSSRVFSNIREKYGLTYYIDAASEQMTDSGYLFARAGVKHENLEKTLKLIMAEFKKLKEKKVGKKELQKAKEYIKGKTLMSLESSSNVASFFGDQELFKREVKKPDEIFKKIDAVTSEDIQKLANKIFVNKGLNLSVIGPHKEAEKLYKLLNVEVE